MSNLENEFAAFQAVFTEIIVGISMRVGNLIDSFKLRECSMISRALVERFTNEGKSSKVFW